MIPAKNSITLACGVNARVFWSMGTCCNCSNKPCCCRNSPNATSIPCSVLLVGQAGDKLLTGASSTCKATPDRSRRAKLHPIRRFAPWLRKTYASCDPRWFEESTRQRERDVGDDVAAVANGHGPALKAPADAFQHHEEDQLDRRRPGAKHEVG